MLYQPIGSGFTAVLENAPPGLVGTLGVRIEDTDDNIIRARTTEDIIEFAPGTYSIDSLIAPNIAGEYLIIWDDEETSTTETLVTYVQTDDGPPRRGVLPFQREGTIETREGALVAPVLCTVFRGSAGSPTAGGQAYDFTAYADENATVALEQQNLVLNVEDDQYRIVDALHYSFAKYVELRLRRVQAGG